MYQEIICLSEVFMPALVWSDERKESLSKKIIEKSDLIWMLRNKSGHVEWYKGFIEIAKQLKTAPSNLYNCMKKSKAYRGLYVVIRIDISKLSSEYKDVIKHKVSSAITSVRTDFHKLFMEKFRISKIKDLISYGSKGHEQSISNFELPEIIIREQKIVPVHITEEAKISIMEDYESREHKTYTPQYKQIPVEVEEESYTVEDIESPENRKKMRLSALDECSF